ncbi:MAG: COX15/CtaA family protein [Dehalococcoidia bacterium]
MTKFQLYALATTLVTFGLVILGGVVRVTDSGLGCPDWPRCHGSFIPPAETEIWIEWSHRLTASITGFLIFGLAIAAWRSQRENRVIIAAAAASLVVLAVQVILGAITVKRELPPEIVATHLVTGLTLLTTLIVITIASFVSPRQPLRVERNPLFPLLAVALLVTITTMWLGAYMTESGANFACDGWPRCNGTFLPEFTRLVRIHWLHRFLALVMGGALVLVALQTRSLFGPRSTLYSAAAAAVGLYGAQVLMGAGNIWTDMSEETSISHLALGSLIWSSLVGLMVASFYFPGRQAAATRGRALPQQERAS